MIGKEPKSIIYVRITELEDKLMDMIEMANNYPDIPVPIFEQEMNTILQKIEKLTRMAKNENQ